MDITFTHNIEFNPRISGGRVFGLALDLNTKKGHVSLGDGFHADHYMRALDVIGRNFDDIGVDAKLVVLKGEYNPKSKTVTLDPLNERQAKATKLSREKCRDIVRSALSKTGLSIDKIK